MCFLQLWSEISSQTYLVQSVSCLIYLVKMTASVNYSTFRWRISDSDVKHMKIYIFFTLSFFLRVHLLYMYISLNRVLERSCWKLNKSLCLCVQTRLYKPSFPCLTHSHLLFLTLLWKRAQRLRGQFQHFSLFFSIFNGNMIYSNDKPLLSLFFFSWVLMSDYFTSHSALDKWPRQAVKNRSKPLGWERGGGKSREAVKSFPSAARQASENATHYTCAAANQSFRVIREEETQQQHLNKPLSLRLK